MGVRCRALADTARTPFGRDYTPRIKSFAAQRGVGRQARFTDRPVASRLRSMLALA